MKWELYLKETCGSYRRKLYSLPVREEHGAFEVFLCGGENGGLLEGLGATSVAEVTSLRRLTERDPDQEVRLKGCQDPKAWGPGRALRR